MSVPVAVPPPAPDPKCPAAWRSARAAGGWLHCILDPLLSPHDGEGWHEDPVNGPWRIELTLGDWVTGRSEPNAQPPAGPCDVRFHGPIRVTCTTHPGWSAALADEHSIGFLARIAAEHETGEPG